MDRFPDLLAAGYTIDRVMAEVALAAEVRRLRAWRSQPKLHCLSCRPRMEPKRIDLSEVLNLLEIAAWRSLGRKGPCVVAGTCPKGQVASTFRFVRCQPVAEASA